ncbi:MAG: hypothetical protein ACAH80_12270 [Alphaproteobacteria bacterium]
MKHYPVKSKAKAVEAPALGLPVKFFLAALTALCFMMLSGVARAQVIEGCDPAVMTAAQSKAQARVAYDVAVTEETIDKPDSVLALTCFNNLAGWAGDGGSGGGSIFSGDFMLLAGYATTIGDGLQGFFDDFVDADGNDSGVVDYAATALSATTTCTETADHWTRIKTEGLQTGVPYALNSDLGGDPLVAPTTPAGGGTNFAANWTQSGADALFTDVRAAVIALPPPLIPAFTPTATSCLTLQAAGVAGSCP